MIKTQDITAEQLRLKILYAMRKRFRVTITYTRANGSETVRTIEPYMLTRNTAGDRYVRAMSTAADGTPEVRTWRLDRMVSLTVHRSRFLVANPYNQDAQREAPADPFVTATAPRPTPRAVAALPDTEAARMPRLLSAPIMSYTVKTVSRYIVRRTAYGFVTYDLDAEINIGRELRTRKIVQSRTDKLNGK